MRGKNHLSINHICLFLGLVLWMAAIGSSIAVLWMTENVVATLCVLGFGVFAFGCGVLFVRIVRKKLVIFSDQLCEQQEVPAQKQQEFLTAQSSQLDKLDFLMQAMIKTSRLETGVISLEQREQSIYETLAAALGGIFLNAEKKKIDVQVDCPEQLLVSHDRKWTTEALFNILDNAVKYMVHYG